MDLSWQHYNYRCVLTMTILLRYRDSEPANDNQALSLELINIGYLQLPGKS